MKTTFKTVAKIALHQSAQPRTIRNRTNRTNWIALFSSGVAGIALIAIATFLGCWFALVSMFS